MIRQNKVKSTAIYIRVYLEIVRFRFYRENYSNPVIIAQRQLAKIIQQPYEDTPYRTTKITYRRFVLLAIILVKVISIAFLLRNSIVEIGNTISGYVIKNCSFYSPNAATASNH